MTAYFYLLTKVRYALLTVKLIGISEAMESLHGSHLSSLRSPASMSSSCSNSVNYCFYWAEDPSAGATPGSCWFPIPLGILIDWDILNYWSWLGSGLWLFWLLGGRFFREFMVIIELSLSWNSWLSSLARRSAFLWFILSKLTELTLYTDWVVVMGSAWAKNLFVALTPLGGRIGCLVAMSVSFWTFPFSGIDGNSKLPYLDSMACASLL